MFWNLTEEATLRNLSLDIRSAGYPRSGPRKRQDFWRRSMMMTIMRMTMTTTTMMIIIIIIRSNNNAILLELISRSHWGISDWTIFWYHLTNSLLFLTLQLATIITTIIIIIIIIIIIFVVDFVKVIKIIITAIITIIIILLISNSNNYKIIKKLYYLQFYINSNNNNNNNNNISLPELFTNNLNSTAIWQPRNSNHPRPKCQILSSSTCKHFMISWTTKRGVSDWDVFCSSFYLLWVITTTVTIITTIVIIIIITHNALMKKRSWYLFKILNFSINTNNFVNTRNG